VGNERERRKRCWCCTRRKEGSIRIVSPNYLDGSGNIANHFVSRTWISIQGSPKSVIESCTFTNDKEVESLEFTSFEIAHEKKSRSSKAPKESKSSTTNKEKKTPKKKKKTKTTPKEEKRTEGA